MPHLAPSTGEGANASVPTELDQDRAARLAELESTIAHQARELVDARDEAQAAVDGLASLTGRLAVASIPLQLVGLLLVAIGTVLATIPALAGA